MRKQELITEIGQVVHNCLEVNDNKTVHYTCATVSGRQAKNPIITVKIGGILRTWTIVEEECK
jgi:hypothetical protein